MNILHLSKYYHPYHGGVESVVKSLSSMHGINSTVLATEKDLSEKHSFIDGVLVIRSREWFSFASTSIAPGYILDLLRAKSPDVIHIHLPNPLANFAFLFAMLFRFNHSKVVLHWHSDIIKQKKLLFIYQPFVKMLLSRADAIIVTTKLYLQGSQQLSGFSNKCHVIPLGVESVKGKVNSSIVKSIRNCYSGKRIVFSLGRHIYYKGFEYLIESARFLDNTVILIGGTGPDTAKYQRLIEQYNLHEVVKLIGRVCDSELPSFYKAADVFCLPSIEKSEAFGVVQLEAMSVGTPVVSCNIKGSGVPWVNKHMESGLICEPSNSYSLSESISTILNDAELHSRLSSGALERFSQHFSIDIMNRSNFSLYKTLIKSKE